MDSSVSRRTLLTGAAAGFGFAFTGSMEAFARPAPRGPRRDSPGTGRSSPIPAGVLSLPAGFSYVDGRPIERHHDRRSAGLPERPGRHGGVRGRGRRIGPGHQPRDQQLDEPLRVPAIPGVTYDPGAIGGTSTVERRRRSGTGSTSTQASPARRTTARAESPLGHLVDLRGDRAQGGPEISPPRTPTTTATSLRSTRRAAKPTWGRALCR